VPLEELVDLAHAHGILLVDDVGSGALVDLGRWGLPKEPTVQESVKAGADIVCFSGDKLLGGPQCGVILGKKNVVDRIKKNQLTRALRCDKMTFAVMEATLRLFLDEETLLENHPVLRMLTESAADIKKRCQSLKRKLRPLLNGRGLMEVVEETSEVGSGSLAAKSLTTWALSIQILDLPAEELAKKLRLSNPPVFGRIKEDVFLLDCRTILREEFNWIYDAFIHIVGPPTENEKVEEKNLAGKETAEKIAENVKEINNQGDSK
jgi:L-seryl-tRNA(Ser) seleniumtransferase